MPARRRPRHFPETSDRRRVQGRRVHYHRRLRLETLEDRTLLAPFAPGDIVALRVGPNANPGAPLTNLATPVFLDEFSADGTTIVQTIALPTTTIGNQLRLTLGGTATTEGMLSRSSNGQYLLLAGYDAPVGGSSSPSSMPSAATKRVVARIDAQGNFDTSTVISDGYDSTAIRGATSTDGTTIWASGGSGTSPTGGIRTLQFGSLSGITTQVSTTTTNTRDIEIFGGQLFVSASTSGLLLDKAGTGTPTTSGQTITGLPGIPSSGQPQHPLSPYQFFAADLTPSVLGIDTLYVADETSSQGLLKFSLVGSTWTFNGGITFNSAGARGLTGSVSGDVVTLYASDAGARQNIWKVVDTAGWNGILSTNQVSAFAPGVTNAAYRGLALAPVNADFGDAPDTYHTLLASNGPYHTPTGPMLGANRDAEADGQPSASADGDDLSNINDEDGVTFATPLLTSATAAHTASIIVNASAAARLDAWIDFNRNGVFDNPSERITAAGGTVVAAGNNTLSFSVPAGASVGSTFARFRLSTAGGLAPTGPADDGEVEDYAVSIAGDAGASAAVALPAGGGSFMLDVGSGQVRLRQGTTTLFATPTNSIASLVINGSSASDALTINLASGNPIPSGGVAFNGNNPTVSPGDTLAIMGGNQGTVTYNYTNAHDGNVVMSSFGTVTYTGLEPIVNSGSASDIVFNLPPGSNAVTLGDDGTTANGLSRLSGSTFELTDFVSPSGSLTINRGSSSDTLTVNDLPDFSADLTIGSAAQPLNSVAFAGSHKLPAGKVRSVAAGNISLSGGSNVQVEINGPAAASQYGHLDVSGAMAINGASLNVSLGYQPTAGTTFTIVNNDASDAVSGTFNGLAEGQIFSVATGPFTANFQITYQGGDGNDVVLTAVNPPTGITTTLAGGVLYIIGTSANDTIVVDQLGSTLRVIDGSAVAFSVSASSVSLIYVAAADGNDQITVDPSLGSKPTYLLGGTGDDVITGGSGNDWISGGAGTDAVDGGAGDDYIAADAADTLGSAKILGGSGRDSLDFSSEVVGVTFNNNGATTSGFEYICGSQANDNIANFGSPSAASIFGFGGDDLLTGGDGNDYLSGGPGNDNLVGNSGNDTLIGGAAIDTFDGGTGSDLIVADAADLMTAGPAPSILGGDGTDSLDFSAETIGITFDNNGLSTNGFEYIYGSQASDTITNAGSGAFAAIFGFSGNDTLTGGGANDYLSGGTGDDVLIGNGGDDSLIGGAGVDAFDGGAGNDYIAADAADTTAAPQLLMIVGGSGSDSLDFSAETSGIVFDNTALATGGFEYIYGGSGNDSITNAGSSTSIAVFGFGGDDVIIGGSASDYLDGGLGNDRLYGGAGNDTLLGRGGNDLLAGNNGNDVLNGHDGNDVLIGGQGTDYLDGGTDNDLLYDGEISVASMGGIDTVSTFGDANDMAMAALLIDWSPDATLDSIVVTSLHDAWLDYLIGGLGSDTASAGSGDNVDAEFLL
jgi:Ca2+-binding RTX toxin-like protein